MTESRIEALRRLKVSALTVLPKTNDSNSVLLLIDKTIRIFEINERMNGYLSGGYYIGYLLLYSQVFEHHIRDIIISSEKYLADNNKLTLLLNRDGKSIDITEQTLGKLIQLLSRYIEYKDLEQSLTDFNKLRKSIVHHLVDDYSRTLSSIESQIFQLCSTDCMDKVLYSLIEVSRRINDMSMHNLLHANPSMNIDLLQKINQTLIKDLNLTSEVITLKL